MEEAAQSLLAELGSAAETITVAKLAHKLAGNAARFAEPEIGVAAEALEMTLSGDGGAAASPERAAAAARTFLAAIEQQAYGA